MSRQQAPPVLLALLAPLARGGSQVALDHRHRQWVAAVALRVRAPAAVNAVGAAVRTMAALWVWRLGLWRRRHTVDATPTVTGQHCEVSTNTSIDSNQ